MIAFIFNSSSNRCKTENKPEYTEIIPGVFQKMKIQGLAETRTCPAVSGTEKATVLVVRVISHMVQNELSQWCHST